MSHDLYQEIILEEYDNPQNQGTLAGADASVHELNASCGDEVTVFVKLTQDHQKVHQVRWQGRGCAISMATTSLLSEFLKEKTVEEVAKLQQADLEALLGIEEISPGRQKCLLLSLKAFQKATDLAQQRK